MIDHTKKFTCIDMFDLVMSYVLDITRSALQEIISLAKARDMEAAVQADYSLVGPKLGTALQRTINSVPIVFTP